MALSPEQNVWLLKFSDNLRSIHYYVVSTAFCNMEDTFFLQKTRWRAVKVSQIVVPIYQVFLILIGSQPKRGFNMLRLLSSHPTLIAENSMNHFYPRRRCLEQSDVCVTVRPDMKY